MLPNKIDLVVPTEQLKNWQDIVDMLASILKIPSALIMRFTDPSIEVFVSSNSESNPYHVGEHEVMHNSGLYCEHVINNKRELLVPNALSDPVWRNNPDVKLNMISYLGFPIEKPDGKPFGTLCVLDNKENHYSIDIEKLMDKLRNLIQYDISILYANQLLGDRNKKVIDYLREIQQFRGMVYVCPYCKKIKGQDGLWHPFEKYMIKHPDADFSHIACQDCASKHDL